jgi:putative transposase
MWLIKPAMRRSLYRCIEAQAQDLGCTVHALGGMPDHIHIVLRMPTKVSVATLAQRLKAISSKFAHDQLGVLSFRWQEGYGAFSLGRPQVEHVVRYVEHQEEHHAGGELWPQWEKTYEEVGPAADRPADGESRRGGDPGR